MRSRITKRAEHTTTHAHRIAGLHRAARKLTGAYVAPGVFDAQAPASPPTPTAPTARLRTRTDFISAGSGALWVVPSSHVTGTGALGVAPASPGRPKRTHTLRVRRTPACVTAAPVDWASVRMHGRA